MARYECVRTLRTPTGGGTGIHSTALLTNGHVITGSPEGVASDDLCAVAVWDLAAGRCLQELSGHSRHVTCAEVMPDGSVVTGSLDKLLKHWDIPGSRCIQTLHGHQSWVNDIVALSQDRVLSCSADCTLKCWNLATGFCEQTIIAHYESDFINDIKCISVLPEDRVASAGYDKIVMVWKLTEARCVRTLTELKGNSNIGSLVTLPNGHLAAASTSKLCVWDVSDGRCVSTFTDQSHRFGRLAALPDGRLISGGYDRTIKLWDVREARGRCLQLLIPRSLDDGEQHDPFPTYLAIHRSGRFVSGHGDGTVRVWMEKGRVLEKIAAKAVARQRACVDVAKVVSTFL